MSLYENLADNIITRDEYTKLKQNYSVRAEEAERQMNALQDALTDLREKGGSGKAWMEHFRKYENLTELDRNAVVSLVDRILVHVGLSRNEKYRDTLWTPWNVKEILQNEVYLGHLVQGKRTQQSYKQARKERYAPSDEWRITKNAHEKN